MVLRDDSKGAAVDPLALANKRYRARGIVTPTVVRPILLSDQLRGGSCAACSGTLGGHLGAIAPDITSGIQGFFGDGGDFHAVINGLTSIAESVIPAFAQAKAAFDEIVQLFGIGSGRREADMITPVQNQIASRLNFVDSLVGPDAMGTSDLNVLNAVLRELNDTRRYWLSMISDRYTFVDGRASQQAANDIMPLIDGTGNYSWPSMIGSPVTHDRWGNPTNGGRIGAVTRRIASLGGGGVMIGGTAISWPVLAVGALAVFLVMGRRRP